MHMDLFTRTYAKNNGKSSHNNITCRLATNIPFVLINVNRTEDERVWVNLEGIHPIVQVKYFNDAYRIARSVVDVG